MKLRVSQSPVQSDTTVNNYVRPGQGSYVTVAESSTSSSRWFRQPSSALLGSCNTSKPQTEGNWQDAETQAVVAGRGSGREAALAAGEMVVAVLAVTSGGGWAAAGEERSVWTVYEMACFLFQVQWTSSSDHAATTSAVLLHRSSSSTSEGR